MNRGEPHKAYAMVSPSDCLITGKPWGLFCVIPDVSPTSHLTQTRSMLEPSPSKIQRHPGSILEIPVIYVDLYSKNADWPMARSLYDRSWTTHHEWVVGVLGIYSVFVPFLTASARIFHILAG